MSPPTQDPQRLRRRRIEAGLNQRELAAKAGIHRSHMSFLERGERGASPGVLKSLAKVLNCEIADLLPAEPEDSAEPDDRAEAGAA